MKKFIILFFIISCETSDVEKYVPIIENSKELIININKERIFNNLDTLKSEKLLNKIAKKKVEQMIANNFISHNNFIYRSKKSQSLYFSENLAYNYSNDSLLLNAYLKSESHKKNILSSKYTHIGNYTKNKYNCCVFAKY